LRQVDHRAVIAWERIMREQKGAATSTVRRQSLM
jgi:integrase/recombinase XerD